MRRCFTGKDLLEKATTTKRFKYSPLSSELKKQTSIAEEQYQKLDKAFEDKTKNKKSRAKSNLIYSKDFTFYKYHKTKDFAAKRSFDSKQNDLREFKNKLELFYHDTEEITTNNKGQKKNLRKKSCVCYCF